MNRDLAVLRQCTKSYNVDVSDLGFFKMNIKIIAVAASLAFSIAAPTQVSAFAFKPNPSLAELRMDTAEKTQDALDILSAKRRAANRLSFTLPKFSAKWREARIEYRALSREIFFLNKNKIRLRYTNKRFALLYYFNKAQLVVSSH